MKVESAVNESSEQMNDDRSQPSQVIDPNDVALAQNMPAVLCNRLFIFGADGVIRIVFGDQLGEGQVTSMRGAVALTYRQAGELYSILGQALNEQPGTTQG